MSIGAHSLTHGAGDGISPVDLTTSLVIETTGHVLARHHISKGTVDEDVGGLDSRFDQVAAAHSHVESVRVRFLLRLDAGACCGVYHVGAFSDLGHDAVRANGHAAGFKGNLIVVLATCSMLFKDGFGRPTAIAATANAARVILITANMIERRGMIRKCSAYVMDGLSARLLRCN